MCVYITVEQQFLQQSLYLSDVVTSLYNDDGIERLNLIRIMSD